MKHYKSAIIFVVLTLVAGISFAGPSSGKSPTDYMKSIDKKLKPLLANAKQNEGKIIKIINRMMDFKALCKASLGKHWDERTDAERKDFTDTLHALIEKNVVARLKDTKNHIVTYESEELDANRATVVSVVADGTGSRAVQIEIAYKLKKKGKGWIVYDMVTDGVSLVSNYRSQFHKIISKDGWDAMMKKMKDKLAQ